MITRSIGARGWAFGIGPTGRRLVLARHYGARWRCGGISVSFGNGRGGYVGAVLGEWIDDTPRSIGFGPLQLVAS